MKASRWILLALLAIAACDRPRTDPAELPAAAFDRPRAPVAPLDARHAPLRAAFDRDAGSPRLLLMASPT